MDDLEDSIRLAIEKGGRINGVDLLDVVANVLAGRLPHSPALAEWFRAAVDAIGHGESADIAFGTKRKQGPDSLAVRNANLDRDGQILNLVDDARRNGYPTSANTEKPSCFDLVSEQMGLPEKTVRSVYYDWETVIEETLPFAGPH